MINFKNVPSGWSSFKIQVDKLDIGTTPVDLSKLSDAVKNEVVKKTEYNALVKKVNNMKTTDVKYLIFILKY